MNTKTIGIIGGMGPAATCDLYRRIIDFTDASCDQEHAHILIDSNSKIPDRTAAILGRGPSPVPELTASAKRLEAAGADFLIIPCNTSHNFLDEIRASVSIPVLDMAGETARHIISIPADTAIVLATEGTRTAGIYDRRFSARGIRTVYPDAELQQRVTDIIYKGIKTGAASYDVSLINRDIDRLESMTGGVTVLACTELPIAVERYGLKGHFVNPTDILAAAAVKEAGCRLVSRKAQS